MNPNKYIYLHVIQGRKNGRWKDVAKIKARKDAQERFKALLTGEIKAGYDSYKMLGARRREDNPEYKGDLK